MAAGRASAEASLPGLWTGVHMADMELLPLLSLAGR